MITAVRRDYIAHLRKIQAAAKQPGFFGDLQRAIAASSRSVGELAAGIGVEQGLGALRKRPADLADPSRWNGPYAVCEIPSDVWGKPYIYRKDPAIDANYELYSVGPDGKDGTPDDIGTGIFRK